MAETGSAGQNAGSGGNAGIIAALLCVFLGPLLLIVFLAVGSGLGSGPNQRGSTAPQAIAAGPASPVAGELLKLDKFSDTSAWLRKNSDVLVQYSAAVTTFLTDEKITSPPDGPKLIAKGQEILKSIAEIQRAVSANDQAGAKKAADQLKKLQTELQQMGSGGGSAAIAVLAVQLTRENVASGYTKFQYNRDGRAQIFSGSGTSDCSSFASFLYYRSFGLAVFKQPLSTGTWAQNARAGRSGLTAVLDREKGPITPEMIRGKIHPGDVLIQNLGVVINGAKQDHALMYVGPGAEGDVVHSSTRSGRNGLQFTTLAERLSRQTDLVIRFAGAPA